MASSWNIVNAVFLILLGVELRKYNTGNVLAKQTTCLVYNRAKNDYPGCSIRDTSKCEVKVCSEREEMCHAMYYQSINGTLEPQLLNCHFPGAEPEHCHENVCTLQLVKAHGFYSCCCYGDKCNGNLVWNPPTTNNATMANSTTPTTVAIATKPKDEMSKTKLLCYTLVPLFGIIIIVGVTLHLLKRLKRLRLEQELLLPQTIASPQSPLMSIEMLEVLQRGHVSCVHKAKYEQNMVAVKILDPTMSQYWENEKWIYENCRLDHENVLHFVKAEKRIVYNSLQYWIVTELHNIGSLADYLREYTLNLTSMLKMLLSIAKGLHYLHGSEDVFGKSVIAHRDFKSCNILVRDDLTCCIGDFGLALAVVNTSKAVMSQVGTNRYMAPEILQGSISFLKESFLYVDIYGFALVMWEILSRCQQNSMIPGPYHPPYFDAVGSNPTIEEMLRCVVEQKKRPHVESKWRKDSTFKSICETMVECWDADAYARLTACCVLERLTQLTQDASSRDDRSLHLEVLS